MAQGKKAAPLKIKPAVEDEFISFSARLLEFGPARLQGRVDSLDADLRYDALRDTPRSPQEAQP